MLLLQLYHLHSTIFILKQTAFTGFSTKLEFTFYYIYIKTEMLSGDGFEKITFTFYYIYIKT